MNKIAWLSFWVILWVLGVYLLSFIPNIALRIPALMGFGFLIGAFGATHIQSLD